MGVLYAKVNGQWVVASPEEVNVSDTDPLATNPDAEIWVDTTLDPPVIKANVGGAWTPIASSDEMSVGAIDPITVNPRIEMWYDTDKTDSAPTLGTLKVNVGGTWHTATSEEVFVDDQDPLSRGNTEAELWYDTTTSELKVQHPLGTWTVVTSDTPVDARDEVLVNPAQPDDPTTELWIDTTTDPPTMKANVNGAWVEIGAPVTGPAPLDEVWVGPVDPRDASTELWYDVDAVPSNLGRTVPASLVDGLITEVSNLKSRLAVLEAYVMNGVSV